MKSNKVEGEKVTEEWRYIPDSDDRYMVSNLGRVKSVWVRRYVHGEVMNIKREKIIHPTDNGNGYLIFTMRKDSGIRQTVYVHRAVAEAFLPKTENRNVINHKDHNKKNNCVDNLEWCTQKENVAFSRSLMCHSHSTFKTSTGEKYISIQKNGRYRVSVRWANIYKTFLTLTEAIEYRDEQMRQLA